MAWVDERHSSHRARSIMALIALASSGTAAAGMIDPNAYASGSMVTGTTPGVTLTQIAHRYGESYLTTHAVFAVEVPECVGAGTGWPCAAPTGTQVLWGGDLNGANQPVLQTTGNLLYLEHVAPGTDLFSADFLQTTGYYSALRVDFENPVDYLSVDFFSLAGDQFGLFLFDATGSLLDLVRWCGHCGELRPLPDVPSIGYWVDTAAVQRSSADVSFALLGGIQSGAGVGGIRFSVPEPGPLGLLLMALSALALGRRRRLDAAVDDQEADGR